MAVPDSFEDSALIRIGVAGALSKQVAADQQAFLPMIAHLLMSSTPESVELIETGLFKKSLRGVVLNEGENRLTLEDSGRGGLQASYTRVVRGIALKTEKLTVEEWVTMVSELLEERAKENNAARNALANALGLE